MQPKIPSKATLKRVCIFAHYDPQNIVDNYVHAYLNALSPFVDRFVFVSTSELSNEERLKLNRSGINVICRENIGYDFCSWKKGLESVEKNYYDEVLLVNDSCYAPLFDFSNIFETMSHDECDFWGLTRSFKYSSHLQSFFICFKKTVVRSEMFDAFWGELHPVVEKRKLIQKYEVGLSHFLRKNNFKMNHYFKISTLEYLTSLPRKLAFRISVTRNLNPYKFLRSVLISNPTFHYYEEMLDQRIPVIKVALLKHDPFPVKPTNLWNVEGINLETVNLIKNHLERLGFKDNARIWCPDQI